MGQSTPFPWGIVFNNFRMTWRVLMKLYHQKYISKFFLRMQKWLFLTPLFNEEYLRTKISTSNYKVPDIIWQLKLLPDHFFHFVAASSKISFWISKFTPVTWLKWWCHQMPLFTKINLCQKLLFFLKLPRPRNFHVNIFCSTTLRLYWIIVLSLH